MSLLDNLLKSVGGNNLGALSKVIGADEGKTQNAIGAALPLLLGALSRNSTDSNGAAALDKALEKDHDGSILDNLGGFLGKQDTSTGNGILKHLLGGKRERIESSIGQASGLDAGVIGKLLPMLAPIVMGQLGRERKQGNLNASGLASMLDGERKEVERRAPQTGGFLTKMLDQDGDGDLDVGDLAKGVLGKLF